ncbi:aspartyl-phosphate phosphatase Spo0E family protein [Paenibacillus sp. 481]|uniref:aspartyl-phosphate phosphatase Spo0E family protein n=1 Tax=Paenibacillus sp. 481 TaxID=2835869 RepID=UPI002FC343B1|nr:aspartyl-phosphate phosphatase Spo0E family protein [Paenibacillus sp. 481]
MTFSQYDGHTSLLYKMNNLQKQLAQAVQEHHSLTADPVVQLSQQLDIYILQCQKAVCTKKRVKEVLQ